MQTYRYIFLSIAMVLCASCALAQGGSTLRGTVVDAGNDEALPFANVGLFRQADSSLVQGTTTSGTGQFVFRDVPEGTYRLRVTFIGYAEQVVNNLRTSGKAIEVGKISLEPVSQELQETEITAERPLMEMDLDRKVYHVDQDIQGQSGSASEVLENIPSVSVSAEGDVSLRGSSNVTYFINGRPSALLRINPAAALQQIPASSIERIEVITNPSAKFRPDGAAGIINIVLKKDRKEGFNGTLSANAGNGGRYNTNLMLGIQKKKVNLFGNYGVRWDQRLRTISDERTYLDSTGMPESYYERNTDGRYRSVSHTANVGGEWHINNKNVFSLNGNGYYRGMDRPKEFSTVSYDLQHAVTENFLTQQDGREDEYEVEGSAGFEHQFGKEDHAIQFELNASTYSEKEWNGFNETYQYPERENYQSEVEIRKSGKQVESVVEYTLPLGEDRELEAGYEGTYNADYIRYSGTYLDTVAGNWKKDLIKSNRFRINQQLHAMYTTYGFDLENLGVMVGVRAEQSILSSHLLNTDSLIPNHYFKLYPSLHLNHEAGEGKEWQFSYTRRVNRPDGDELNPFGEYNDPRHVEAGNPALKPEQIHSVELGYQRTASKASWSSTLFYRYVFDALEEVTSTIMDSVILTTLDNLASEQAAGWESTFQGKPFRWLSVQGSGTVYYNEVNAINLGYTTPKSNVTWSARVNSNVYLPRKTLVQVTTRYNAPRLGAQGRSKGSFVCNLGARKKLWDDKASLVVTVSDVFNTSRWGEVLHTPEMDQVYVSHRRSQILYIGFTWQFGKAYQKQKEDIQFDNGQ
ncbi:MAG: TonB-dependent receptor [Flavobacteriales bacterium]|nr:TonB-dependent receptor [Flavobacteriales bacterium]MCB9449700.1 TonB-dependent receptor [Flavobacteriales bacterium]